MSYKQSYKVKFRVEYSEIRVMYITFTYIPIPEYVF